MVPVVAALPQAALAIIELAILNSVKYVALMKPFLRKPLDYMTTGGQIIAVQMYARTAARMTDRGYKSKHHL